MILLLVVGLTNFSSPFFFLVFLAADFCEEMAMTETKVLSEKEIVEVLNNGKYFWDAATRYASIQQQVFCDVCHRCPVDSCIGYKSIDICLSCVIQISLKLQQQQKKQLEKETTPRTRMMQSMFQAKPSKKQPNPTDNTLMMQSMFQSSSSFMMQSMFQSSSCSSSSSSSSLSLFSLTSPKPIHPSPK